MGPPTKKLMEPMRQATSNKTIRPSMSKCFKLRILNGLPCSPKTLKKTFDQTSLNAGKCSFFPIFCQDGAAKFPDVIQHPKKMYSHDEEASKEVKRQRFSGLFSRLCSLNLIGPQYFQISFQNTWKNYANRSRNAGKMTAKKNRRFFRVFYLGREIFRFRKQHCVNRRNAGRIKAKKIAICFLFF